MLNRQPGASLEVGVPRAGARDERGCGRGDVAGGLVRQTCWVPVESL